MNFDEILMLVGQGTGLYAAPKKIKRTHKLKKKVTTTESVGGDEGTMKPVQMEAMSIEGVIDERLVLSVVKEGESELVGRASDGDGTQQ
ncbi:hypothetical protein Dimus_035916 [Dionaea muscipula]